MKKQFWDIADIMEPVSKKSKISPSQDTYAVDIADTHVSFSEVSMVQW